jgi:glycyl-tRNA synthetase beta chain
MSTLLIEVGCEELPANACDAALAQAGPLVERLLLEHRLAPASVRALVAPRRIAVLAEGVPEAQAAELLVHRGPPESVAFGPDGEISKAGAGFARRHNRAAHELVRRDGFVFVEADAEAHPAAAVLPEIVRGLVEGLAFPKNMRWGSQSLRFARPIRWLVCLHGSEVIDVELAGVRAGRTSQGHRFLGGPVELPVADDYERALRDAFVVADAADRERRIRDGLDQHAGWADPGGVLAEVVHLTEWPSVLRGSFPERFLELPDRVIVTVMQSHQRYLPLLAADGTPSSHFCFVANSGPAAAETVVTGNERVVRGRLDDAAFSLAKDLEVGLEGLAEGLARISYHARAGSLADRTTRLESLVDRLARALGIVDESKGHALRAAVFAKADQASRLVGEFAELEGYVGAVYARRAGFPDAVAVAIEEQYLPAAAGAAPPASEPGALVALADKLDSLGTAFALGEQPTGSRDPYGLRRAAAGVVAIVLDRGWSLDLGRVVEDNVEQLRAQGADTQRAAGEVSSEVVAFVLDRVDAVLAAEGVPAETLRAARGADGVDPLGYAELARALRAAGPELAAARAGLERCRRIAVRGQAEAASSLSPGLFSETAEIELARALTVIAPRIAEAAARRAFAAGLGAAAELAPAIDRFFADVMVMDEDPAVRGNRLRLMIEVVEATRPIGDLSALPGAGG